MQQQQGGGAGGSGQQQQQQQQVPPERMSPMASANSQVSNGFFTIGCGHDYNAKLLGSVVN
jgi:hypothetical protein